MSFLPEQSTLEPSGGVPPNAVYIRLTNDAVDSILAGDGKGVRLSLGPRMELKVGDRAFSTSSVAEACPIDLYTRKGGAATSQFANIGSVTHRITVQKSMDSGALASSLKSQTRSLAREKEANKATLLDASSKQQQQQSKPGSPAPAASTNKHRTLQISASRPLSSQALSSGPNRVVHLLALGPTTSQTIASRTNLPQADVDAILDQYAHRGNEDGVFVLADNRYKELRVWDWRHYSADERRRVIADSTAAFDRLALPPDHPARKNLIDPKLRKQQSSGATPKASPQPSPKPSTPTTTTTTTTTNSGNGGAVKRPGAILKTGTNKKTSSKPSTLVPDSTKQSPVRNAKPPAATTSSPSSSGTGATKRKTSPSDAASAASTTPPTKKQRSTVDEDLFELARKFRQAYGEYAKLYNRMSSSAERKKSKADVQKLLSMHRELQSWKNKLWSIAPSSSKSLV
ncbi:hypothetical protein TRICI_003042 [Trichomonascus ciferrii]|uniref:RNA polymerase II elongation factor ELL N-terminal domain-containing protein n=1 Tax=Trichomonascus ciferrii TaxID=44093 RepID=A0A642V4Z7_9ASCO|nr:hypothetical protein TRICI_003042 [Trichomonascus ciferrii]